MAKGKARAMLSLWAAGALAAGCSMSAEWWIRHGLREAGFSRAEASCIVRGVKNHLSREEIWELRGAVSGWEPPEKMADVDHLLAWLEPRVEPEVHRIAAHYGRGCVRR